jgi:hypothetical protein
VPLNLPAGAGNLQVSRDGRFFVYLLAGHVEIWWRDSGHRQQVPLQASGFEGRIGRVRLSSDARTLYLKKYDTEGRASFWSVPLAGGTAWPLVSFDDPARPSNRPEFAVSDTHFFFTIDERRSNIWVADVSPRAAETHMSRFGR